MRHYIGIDGGGSGCRALLTDSTGQVLGKGKAGPANIGADMEGACSNIRVAAERATANAGLEPTVLPNTYAALGLAGAGSIKNITEVTARLPFKQTQIFSDAFTALQGAIGDGDGAIVITGTGSAFVKRIDSAIEVVGGRGFMLSDHAGGARLGRELLEATLLAKDGLCQSSPLVEEVIQQFKGDLHQIILFSRSAQAVDYGKFTPLIFEYERKGDEIARRILTRACEYLHSGLKRIGVETLGRFSMTGGLASSYMSLSYFPFREFYAPPLGDSLNGALALALRMQSQSECDF